jgi:hypothetical protein
MCGAAAQLVGDRLADFKRWNGFRGCFLDRNYAD